MLSVPANCMWVCPVYAVYPASSSCIANESYSTAQVWASFAPFACSLLLADSDIPIACMCVCMCVCSCHRSAGRMLRKQKNKRAVWTALFTINIAELWLQQQQQHLCVVGRLRCCPWKMSQLQRVVAACKASFAATFQLQSAGKFLHSHTFFAVFSVICKEI